MSLDTEEILSVDRPFDIRRGRLPPPTTPLPGPGPKGGTGGGGPTGLLTVNSHIHHHTPLCIFKIGVH